jgi:hypothetical protein
VWVRGGESALPAVSLSTTSSSLREDDKDHDAVSAHSSFELVPQPAESERLVTPAFLEQKTPGSFWQGRSSDWGR